MLYHKQIYHERRLVILTLALNGRVDLRRTYGVNEDMIVGDADITGKDVFEAICL